jgi:LmbE family N-acetylglucosaminyl deacetylase
MRLPNESDLIPYAAGFPPGRRWLVLAPHADDETLGPGATLAQGVDRGIEIKVVIVTDGAQQGSPGTREAEAAAAGRELGVGAPDLWRLPDRGLADSLPRLREALITVVERFSPDTLFVPSPVELHPDHRAVAIAAQCALRRRTWLGLASRSPRWVAAYEVCSPLQPNLLVAADDGWERKRRAVACYASQLAVSPYESVTAGLAAVRCLTLPGCGRAEAFHLLPTRAVVRRSARGWAALMGSPLGVTPRRRRP